MQSQISHRPNSYSRHLMEKQQHYLASLRQIIATSQKVTNRAGFQGLMEAVNQLVPFDLWSATLTELNRHNKMMEWLHLANFPPAWEARYVEQGYTGVDPISIRNFEQEPLGCLQRWSQTYKRQTLTPIQQRFMQESLDYSNGLLADGYTIGWQTNHRHEGLIFSVAGPRIQFDQQTEFALECLAPYFNEAMATIWDNDRKLELSEKECETLEAAMQGLSIDELARMLGVTPDGVKYRLKTIKQKLQTSNTKESITVALQRGIKPIK